MSLSLSETYKAILLESENEDQAEKILKKAYPDAEKETFVNILNNIKKGDPTEQKKFLPVLTYYFIRTQKEVGYKFIDDIISDAEYIGDGLQILDNNFNINPILTKKGVLFNKDKKEVGIRSDKPITDPIKLYAIIEKVREVVEKREKLKKADEPETELTPIAKGDGIEVYAGNSESKCITLSKGTDFCIGQPQTGQYHQHRQEGSSFYFIINHNMDEPSDIFVLDVRNEDDWEEVVAYDRNNEPHTLEDFDGLNELYDYLEANGIDPSIFSYHPYTGDEQELQELIRNKKNGEEFKDKIVGSVFVMDNGEAIDLTRQHIMRHGLTEEQWNMIKDEPAFTKKRKMQYLWRFLSMDPMVPEGIAKDIPNKLTKKYLSMMLEKNANPSFYVLKYTDKDILKKFIREKIVEKGQPMGDVIYELKERNIIDQEFIDSVYKEAELTTIINEPITLQELISNDILEEKISRLIEIDPLKLSIDVILNTKNQKLIDKLGRAYIEHGVSFKTIVKIKLINQLSQEVIDEYLNKVMTYENDDAGMKFIADVILDNASQNVVNKLVKVFSEKDIYIPLEELTDSENVSKEILKNYMYELAKQGKVFHIAMQHEDIPTKLKEMYHKTLVDNTEPPLPKYYLLKVADTLMEEGIDYYLKDVMDSGVTDFKIIEELGVFSHASLDMMEKYIKYLIEQTESNEDKIKIINLAANMGYIEHSEAKEMRKKYEE